MARIPYEVVEAFKQRKAAQSGNFYSNGHELYSYALRLAHWEEERIHIDVNLHIGYSATTMRHVRALRERI